MATRTIQFLGQAYGATPASVVATWNGNTIYSGTVPTVDQTGPAENYIPNEILFTLGNVDVTLQAEIPVTIEVTAGNVYFGTILGNYANVYTTVGNVTTVSSSGPTTFLAINNNINNGAPDLGDVRSNVLIDGVAPVIVRDPATTGTWSYMVRTNSTIAFDADLDSGQP